MGYNDHIDYELDEAINDLFESGYLEKGSAAYGIAQFVIHNGYNSLSSKQRFVYDKEVLPLLEEQELENRITQILNSNPD